MNESGYSKYFITELKKNIVVPQYRNDKPGQGYQPELPKTDHVIWLDDEVIPNAKIYSECVWYWPWELPKKNLDDEKMNSPHVHNFDEIIAFYGTDLNDPKKLYGKIELWLDGEQHFLTETFMAFVPAGMSHGPLIIHKLEKPVFHFTIGPSDTYE